MTPEQAKEWFERFGKMEAHVYEGTDGIYIIRTMTYEEIFQAFKARMLGEMGGEDSSKCIDAGTVNLTKLPDIARAALSEAPHD